MNHVYRLLVTSNYLHYKVICVNFNIDKSGKRDILSLKIHYI